MTEFWNIHEIVERAYRELSRNEWDFIVGGTETETTLRRNRIALDSMALRPNVLRNVSQISWSTKLFDRDLRFPVIMAPIGKQQYHGGAASVAKVAASFGCAFSLSSVNTMTSIEDIAGAAPTGVNVYQLYVRGNRDWLRKEVDRATATQCTALCVTVDTVMISRRERDFANRYTSLGRRQFDGASYQASFDWNELSYLRDICKIPLIVKGIVNPDDVSRALALGVDGIYISNHGGRQIDHGIGAVESLREITSLAKGKTTIIVDGGFCRGTDIVKGVAMGADAIGIGRIHCLALAAAGEAGVLRMLELMEDELEIAMGLCGVVSLKELNESFLRPVTPVDIASPYERAFPLLEIPKHRYR